MDFLQDPPKDNIFYANRFLHGLQKKSKNKLCLELHDTYLLFRTFFSQGNNKLFFFIQAVPLISTREMDDTAQFTRCVQGQ